MNERELFAQALQIDDAEARAAFLDEACGDDREMRNRIEELLAEQAELGSFLEKPAQPKLTEDWSRIAEQPGDSIGPYKLLQQIGEGGMGVVYMAEQRTPVKRRVALKIIKPGMDTRQVITRFEAERQALAMMEHPHIARVLDAGSTESGRPYFVMELVNGVPLTDFCDEQQLTPRERLKLFVPVCQAVQHAHQKGIIHRDLKPSNILVALYDDVPVPKVIDFGVAKATSQSLTEKTLFTQLGQLVGTLDYMSPEQAQRNQLDVDTRSDVYSLGVVLYELLTGETPFSGERLRSAGLDEMLRIIREEDPPRPSNKLSTSATLAAVASKRRVEPRRLSSLVRGELDWIVMRALEKQRSRRYDSASALAEDVERYLHDEPVKACPPSLGYRLRKFLYKRRAVALAGAAIFVSLLAVTIISLAMYAQSERLREAAVRAKAVASRHRDQLQIALHERDAAAQINRQALRERQEALLQRQKALRESTAIRLAAQSSSVLTEDPGAALLLALAGVEQGGVTKPAMLNEPLVAALTSCRERKTLPVAASLNRENASHAVVTRVRLIAGDRVLLTAEIQRRLKVKFGNVHYSHRLTEGMAQIWTENGDLQQTIAAPPGQPFAAVKISPDGRLLAGRFERAPLVGYVIDGPQRKREGHLFTDRVVRVWDVQSGKPLCVLRGHNLRVSSLQFSPDSLWIFTTSWDGTARVWDARTGKPIAQLASGRAALDGGELNADGTRYFVLSRGDLRSGKYRELETQGSRSVHFVDPLEYSARPIYRVDRGRSGEGYARLSSTVGIAIQSLAKKLPINLDGVRIFDAQRFAEIRPPAPESASLPPDRSAPSPEAKNSPPAGKEPAPPTSPLPVQVEVAGRQRLQTNCAAFSSDGRSLFIGTTVGRVLVLSSQKGRLKTAYASRGRGGVRGIDARGGQGRLLLTYDNGGLAVIDPAKGEELRYWPPQRTGGIGKAMLTAQGSRVVVVQPKSSAYRTALRTSSVYDVASGRQAVVLRGHADNVLDADVHPERSVAVTCGLDGTARLWTTSDHAGFGKVLGGGQPLRTAAISPDGKRVVLAPADPPGESGVLGTLWDAQSGKQLAQLKADGDPQHLRFQLGGVRVARFSPDGARILTVSDDREVRMLKPDLSGQVLFGNQQSKWPVAKTLPPTAVRIWDGRTGRLLQALKGIPLTVADAQFNSDGSQILTVCRQGRLYRYVRTDKGVSTSLSTGSFSVGRSALPQLHLWDVPSGRLLTSVKAVTNPREEWTPLAWGKVGTSSAVDGRPGGKVAADWIASPRVMGLLSLRERRWRVLPGMGSRRRPLFGGAGRWLLTTYNEKMTLYDLRTLVDGKGGFQEDFRLRDFRPGGQSAESRVAFGKSSICSRVELLGHTQAIRAAAISADGKWVASASADRTARIWDAASGKRLHVLRGHLRAVRGICFSEDGARVATISDDQTAKVWDRASGQLYCTFRGHESTIHTVQFRPDGRALLTASSDGAARLWPLDLRGAARERLPRDFTSEERERYGVGSPPSDN